MVNRQRRLRRLVRELKEYFQGNESISVLVGMTDLEEFTAAEIVHEILEAIADGELGEWENYGRIVSHWTERPERPEKPYPDDEDIPF